MTIVMVSVGIGAGLLLIGIGVWYETRTGSPAPPATFHSPPGTSPAPDRVGPVVRVQMVVRGHPTPLWGVIETGFWLCMAVTLIDHLRDTREGITAWFVWLYTIGPHEIGHLICLPFGWTLHFAGGSIWQVLLYVLLAVYVFVVHRRITMSLLFWALTGHSLINLAVYIDDARARDLPLLFGMDSSHHDWWSLLNKYDLLAYDHTLATATRLGGIGLVLLGVSMGLLTTWALPRTHIGPILRFEGGFFRALRAAFRNSEDRHSYNSIEHTGGE